MSIEAEQKPTIKASFVVSESGKPLYACFPSRCIYFNKNKKECERDEIELSRSDPEFCISVRFAKEKEDCLICKEAFEEGIGRFCQECWDFWYNIRNFSQTVTKQLENQEDVLTYLKSKTSDKRLSLPTRNFISSFLKSKEEN